MVDQLSGDWDAQRAEHARARPGSLVAPLQRSGHIAKIAQKLSKEVRQDPRFERIQSWEWSKGREIELWKRRATAQEPESSTDVSWR